MSAEDQKSGWPVYLATAAMVPLTVLGSLFVFSVVAVAMALSRGGDLDETVQSILHNELSKGATAMALSVGANALVFTLVPMILAYRRAAHSEQPYQRLGFAPASLFDHTAAIFGLLGLTSALDASVQLLGFHDYGRLAEMRDAIVAIPLVDRWPLAFVVAVGAGIPEEIFFRGYALRRLAIAHGKIPAVIVSSLLFGIFHLDPLHAPLAASMGLFLGFVVLKTGSIYPAISAHAINNAAATMTAGLEFDESYLWPTLFAGTVVALGTTMLIVRRHRDAERPIVW